MDRLATVASMTIPFNVMGAKHPVCPPSIDSHVSPVLQPVCPATEQEEGGCSSADDPQPQTHTATIDVNNVLPRWRWFMPRTVQERRHRGSASIPAFSRAARRAASDPFVMRRSLD